MSSGNIRFIPLRRADAEAMLSWRYPAPYNFYDASEGPTEAAIAVLLAAGDDYLTVIDGAGQMIGFRSHGKAAQVEGGEYTEDAIDIGGGLKPDMMARGLGRRVASAAIQYAIERYKVAAVRTTLPSFNERAKSICRSLGFRRTGGFERPSDGLWFEIMTLTVQPSGPAGHMGLGGWGSSPGSSWKG